MKTNVSLACILAFVGAWAFTAQSDEPVDTTMVLRFNTSETGKQLIDTLALNYDKRLAEYQNGRSTPSRLIELNREMFDEQIASVASDHRKLVAERYLERAKTIEDVANKHLANGVGSSMDILDAKAARLRATIELATVSDFTNKRTRNGG
jgi:hypothetical protein